MGIDGKHLVCEYVGAVRLRIILEQVQNKTGVSVDYRPVQGRTSSAVWQVAAASVEPENSVLKTVQNRLGNQPLPSHGNADLKFVFCKKTGGFLILQPVGMGLKHRNPVLVRQIGKPLIAGHLIAGEHIAVNRHYQIHRMQLFLYIGYDLRRRILYAEYNNSVLHFTSISERSPVGQVVPMPYEMTDGTGRPFTKQFFETVFQTPAPFRQETPSRQSCPFARYPAAPLILNFLYTSRWRAGFRRRNHSPDHIPASPLPL